MEANEMEAGTWDQGGQALEEFEGRHDDMGGAVSVAFPPSTGRPLATVEPRISSLCARRSP